jgi:hypothetical protein
MKNQNWQYKKSRIFSSLLGAKSYEDDAKTVPLIKLSMGQKRIECFSELMPAEATMKSLAR